MTSLHASPELAYLSMELPLCILLLLLQASVYGASSLGGSQTSVIDHPVVWSLSGLDAKSERVILDALFDLRSAPEVITLSAGKLVRKVDNRYNYALLARFPSMEALTNYYNTRLTRVILLMLPYLRAEHSVDYQAYIDPSLNSKIENATVHITLLNIKLGTSESVIEAALDSVRSLAQNMSSLILQITAGKNNYDRDITYSHAFSAHLAPGSDSVEKFHNDPSYKLVMEQKLRPICDKILPVDYYFPKNL